MTEKPFWDALRDIIAEGHPCYCFDMVHRVAISRKIDLDTVVRYFVNDGPGFSLTIHTEGRDPEVVYSKVASMLYGAYLKYPRQGKISLVRVTRFKIKTEDGDKDPDTEETVSLSLTPKEWKRCPFEPTYEGLFP